MVLPAPTIVIFDMDGTVVKHINPRLLEILERLDDAQIKLKNSFGIANTDKPRRKRPRLLVHRAIHRFRRKPVEQIVQPSKGVRSLLEYLASHDIPMGLVSNGLGKGYGHDILATFNLEEYFAATVFREDMTHSKPHPAPLLDVLQRMGVRPTQDDVIWYIGDRHKDVQTALAAAKQLSCPCIPIAYSINAAMALVEKKLHPDQIRFTFEEIERDIRALHNKAPAL